MSEELIPKAFYSFEKDGLFEHCIACERALLEEGVPYFIEKAIKNHSEFGVQDVVFDYAICLECAGRMREKISPESWQEIVLFFEQNIDAKDHAKRMHQTTEENLSKCMITHKPEAECSEYQIFAYCNGRRLDTSNPPYMISGEAIDSLQVLLSDATLDEMSGFFDRHFTPDPSVLEPRPRLVLI